MSKNKVKNESKLKKKINEMKQTSKGKAILKLIGWAIFFFILFIFLVISSMLPQVENENDNPVKAPSSNTEFKSDDKEIIKQVQNDLLTKNYDYTYEIKVNDIEFTYEGNKNGNVDKGYKTTLADITKYYIDDTGIYKEAGKEKILIDDLYIEINPNYIDLKYILSVLNHDKLIKVMSENNSVFYEFNDSVNQYTFAYYNYSESNTYNVTITIKNGNDLYTLSYRNVGSK